MERVLVLLSVWIGISVIGALVQHFLPAPKPNPPVQTTRSYSVAGGFMIAREMNHRAHHRIARLQRARWYRFGWRLYFISWYTLPALAIYATLRELF